MAKEVSRSLSGIKDQIEQNKQASKDLSRELNILNKALQLDPTNIDTVNKKFDVFAKQAELGTQNIDILSERIDILNSQYLKGDISTDAYNKQLERLTKESELAQVQVDALNSALDRQQTIINQTKIHEFNKGITDSTKNLKPYTYALSGVNSLMSSLNGLLDNWRDMSWFQRVIKAITLSVSGMATAMAIFKTTVNPANLALILAGATAVALTIGAVVSAFTGETPEIPEVNLGGANTQTATPYNAQDLAQYSTSTSTPNAQSTTSVIELKVDVQGGNDYNYNIGYDIGKELVNSRNFIDSLSVALGSRVVRG